MRQDINLHMTRSMMNVRVDIWFTYLGTNDNCPNLRSGFDR